MDQSEITVLAKAIANEVRRDIEKNFIEKLEEHERILKGKNGDVGLVAKNHTLEKEWKSAKTFFGIGGGAIIVDIALRLWGTVTQ